MTLEWRANSADEGDRSGICVIKCVNHFDVFIPLADDEYFHCLNESITRLLANERRDALATAKAVISRALESL